jgi:hypothetical protein
MHQGYVLLKGGLIQYSLHLNQSGRRIFLSPFYLHMLGFIEVRLFSFSDYEQGIKFIQILNHIVINLNLLERNFVGLNFQEIQTIHNLCQSY